MDKKHLYLPNLAAGSTVSQPEQSGVWYRVNESIFRGISDSIVVDQQAVRRGVSSIPDVWARPLLFQAALSSRPTRQVGEVDAAKIAQTEDLIQLHDRTVREWRGLLSLLALHAIHEWKVELIPVDIEHATGPLATALRNLAPPPVQLERDVVYSWQHVVLIRCSNGRSEPVTVGGFSPSTLVFTAVDYARHLKEMEGISVIDENGYLRPPEDKGDLGMVFEWISKVRDRLSGIGQPAGFESGGVLFGEGTDRGRVAGIHALLKDWIAELKQVFNAATTDFDGNDADVAPVDKATGQDIAYLRRYRVYGELCRPMMYVDDARRSRSDMLLTVGTRNQSVYHQVVVITPRLLQRDARIWDAKRLEHVGGEPIAAIRDHFPKAWGDAIDRQELRTPTGRAIWVRPELYFLSDHLLSTEDGHPALTEPFGEANGLDGLASRYLLPFRKEILDFFSPQEIRTVLQPAFKSLDGAVQFSFSLPVTTRDGKVKTAIERTYRHKNRQGNEGTIETIAVPTIELFPIPVDQFWRRYYLLHDSASKLTVNPLLRPLVKQPAPVGGTATDPQIIVERVHRDAMGVVGARVVAISRDDAYPEALELVQEHDGKRPLGLILTPPPKTHSGRSGELRIGIDFGTSNTNIYRLRPEDDQAQRWRFNFPAYLQPVTKGVASQRTALLSKYLVPDVAVDLPTPTTLKIFAADTRTRLHGENPDALLDFFIHFPSDFTLPDNVYADIKWEAQTAKVQPFLESLLFLILLEASAMDVEHLQLECSYPKAFTVQNVQLYKEHWELVKKRLLSDTHRVITPQQSNTGSGQRLKVEGPRFGKEGVAAGYYFKGDKTVENPLDRANIALGSVCLDVGGGTTDISIWHQQRILADASVLLAGRHISQLLQRNEGAIGCLFSKDAAAALEEKRREPTAFAARLNIILKQEEKEVKERLVQNAQRPEVQWIRQMIAIEFGAIAFYTASLIGAADKAVDGALMKHIAASGIKLHWGGNAAKFLNWIDFGKYIENGVASRMLNAILYNALQDLGTPPNGDGLRQLQSPGHKSEAAGGLVVMPSRDFDLADGAAVGPPIAIGGAAQASPYAMGTPNAAPRLPASQFAMPSSTAEATANESNGVVSGEEITLSGDRVVKHTDYISEPLLFKAEGTTFTSTSLTRLTRFVEIVNFFGISFGLFNDQTRIDLPRYALHITNAMAEKHIAAQNEPANQRKVEPIFISEVKALLELLREKGK